MSKVISLASLKLVHVIYVQQRWPECPLCDRHEVLWTILWASTELIRYDVYPEQINTVHETSVL